MQSLGPADPTLGPMCPLWVCDMGQGWSPHLLAVGTTYLCQAIAQTQGGGQDKGPRVSGRQMSVCFVTLSDPGQFAYLPSASVISPLAMGVSQGVTYRYTSRPAQHLPCNDLSPKQASPVRVKEETTCRPREGAPSPFLGGQPPSQAVPLKKRPQDRASADSIGRCWNRSVEQGRKSQGGPLHCTSGGGQE